MIAALGLSGDAATAMSALIQRPPAVEPLTIAGGALPVVSVLGFTRAATRSGAGPDALEAYEAHAA